MRTIVIVLQQCALDERGWPSLAQDPNAAVGRAARSIAYVATHDRVVVAHCLSRQTSSLLADRLERELGRAVVHISVEDAGTAVPGADGQAREQGSVALCEVREAQDADVAASDLAVLLDAEMFIVATAAPVVWDAPDGDDDEARAVRSASPSSLESIAPERALEGTLDAAMRFVETTGRFAAVGAIDHLEAMVAGEGGTLIRDDGAPMAFYGADARRT
jgi:carbamate kinase